MYCTHALGLYIYTVYVFCIVVLLLSCHNKSCGVKCYMVSEVGYAMAAYQISVIQMFSFKSELWESWLCRFECFRETSGLAEKPEEIQISMLIYSMRDRSEDILKSFALTEGDSKKYSVDIAKFNIHLGKRHNVIYDRQSSTVIRSKRANH